VKIVTLTENTSVSEEYGNEHGLSLYIETETHQLLFDVGASSLFAENAENWGLIFQKWITWSSAMVTMIMVVV